MREVSFIMPTPPDASSAHWKLQNALANQFGGFSCHETSGAWTDDNTGTVIREVSIRYSVAAVWDIFQRDRLTRIAMAAGKRLHQKCVYFVWEDGEAEIRDV